MWTKIRAWLSCWADHTSLSLKLKVEKLQKWLDQSIVQLDLRLRGVNLPASSPNSCEANAQTPAPSAKTSNTQKLISAREADAMQTLQKNLRTRSRGSFDPRLTGTQRGSAQRDLQRLQASKRRLLSKNSKRGKS